MAETSSNPATLATLPSVTASHLIGAVPHPLAFGPLSLEAVSPTDGATASSGQDIPILLLKVEDKVFPLYKKTIFGTHAEHEEAYTFSVPLPETKEDEGIIEDNGAGASAAPPVPPKEQSMWVRLVLAPLNSPEKISARDKFETVLIEHKLLLDGVEAHGDEIGANASQSGATYGKSINEAAEQHRATTDPLSGEGGGWKFSPWSHRAVQSASGSTATMTQYTTRAARAVSDLSAAAGSAMGKAYKNARDAWNEGEEHKPADSEEKPRMLDNTRSALSNAYEGISSGWTSLTSSASAQAPKVTAHHVGEEAVDLAGGAKDSVANVGKAAADLTIGTSSVFHGAMAAKGAVQEGSTEENDQAAASVKTAEAEAETEEKKSAPAS